MEWSFSESATFARCPRQWYFKNHLANANATRFPIRRKAYALSKLDSVWAWRGKIVDRVISRYVVSALRSHHQPELADCLARARCVFDQQLALGTRSARHFTAPSMGDEFSGFHGVEYGTGLSDEEIAQAWTEIRRALTNLCTQRDLIALLMRATGLAAQRSLRLSLDLPVHGKVMVKATPDLIAFFEGRPPLIVDWKVRSVIATEARLQLTVYALALTRGQAHKDFPEGFACYGPQDVQLFESRLLEGVIREYTLTDDDVADLEAYIFESLSRMTKVLDGKVASELRAEDFPTTRYPEVCARCNFREICWEDPTWRESSPTFFQF